jgi:UDP-N-acetyl-2-amino-2-deoxyglucuronate dehydrogenase
MSEQSRTTFAVGIRGAGQVAYEHARAIAANPHLRLAAVCSRRPESAQALASWASPGDARGGPRVYEHYEDMLADPSVDIVSVCMPNYLHAREAIAAFEAGKHLILEKPPAISFEELKSLRLVARRAKGRSVVSFVSRWHPMVRNLRALLDQRAIGDIYYTEVDYWHGIKPTFSSYPWIRRREFAGGAMITGGCHAADLARYFKGEVEEVSAYRCRSRDDFDYPTTLVAAVRFVDGTVGKLSASLDGLAFPYQMNIDLLGSGGAIRDNRIYSKLLFPEQNDFVTVATSTINSGAVSHHPFQQEFDNLVENLLGDAPVLSDVLDACNSIAVSLAIEQSAATGKPVGVPVEER